MRLSWPNRWSFGLVAGVAALRVRAAPGEVKQDRRAPHVVQMLQRQIHALADDPLVLCDRRADQVGRQFEHRVGGEARREPFLGQFDAVALDAGKRISSASRPARTAWTLHRLARRLRRRDDRLGREVERDAEHVGIFDVEQAFVVQLVGLPAQAAADRPARTEAGCRRRGRRGRG